MELLVANTSDKLYTPVLMHLPPYLSAVATPEKLGRDVRVKSRSLLIRISCLNWA